MGFAIIEMFETGEEAEANVERIAKELKVDKERLFVFNEAPFPQLWDGTKKFSVSLD